MANYDIAQSTYTDMTNVVSDYSVDSKSLDHSEDEVVVDFPKSAEYYGYYKSIPELKSSIDALKIWTAGKGIKSSINDKPILDKITGWGEDTIQSILQSLIVDKKVIGDSFAEIIRNNNGTLVNVKPISPERMRIVVGSNGLIKRYEVNTKTGWKKLKKEDVLHLCNDRIADENHGTSLIESCKWVIDAIHEALTDERMIKHRELALGVLYVDTDDTTKRNAIMTQYANAVKNGEVLVLPKDVAELKDTNINPKERIAWIQFLQNYFYQITKVPKVIATSEGFTEAGGKVGFLTFEPIYTNEQTLLEADLWNQLGIKVTFNRPPSLMGVESENETKNTGQTGFQPKDVKATMNRE